MADKITSPAPFTGSTTFGPTHVTFTDGVALTDELPDSLRRYFERRGYTVEEEKPRRRAAAKASTSEPTPDEAPAESPEPATEDAPNLEADTEPTETADAPATSKRSKK